MIPTPNRKPYLFIIMRNDLPSMNPGLLAAQASHVSNAFRFEVTNQMAVPGYEQLSTLVQEWESETEQGFGTAIVKSASEAELQALPARLATVPPHEIVAFGFVHDPTYPTTGVPKAYLPVLDAMLNTDNPNNQIIERENDLVLLSTQMVGMYVFGYPDVLRDSIGAIPLWD